MNKIEELLKLAEEATPGEWYHCQPFETVPATRTIHGPVSAQRVDFVSTKPHPVHKKIVIPMSWEGPGVSSNNMAFIAAAANFIRSEEFKALAKDAEAVDDLAALVRRLAHSLHKADPDNDLTEKALDYIRRKGLQGSPLRKSEVKP